MKTLLRNSLFGIGAVLIAAGFLYRSPTQKKIDTSFHTIEKMEVVYQDNRIDAANKYDNQFITITGYASNPSAEYRPNISYDGGRTFVGGRLSTVAVRQTGAFWHFPRTASCTTTDDLSQLHADEVITIGGNISLPTGRFDMDLNVVVLENCHQVKE